MTIEIKGTVKEMFDTKQITEKFAQKEVIVTIDAHTTYPQHISVQANNDKISLLDSVEIGDSVTIVANLNGREAKGRYYNSLTIFKLNVDKF